MDKKIKNLKFLISRRIDSPDQILVHSSASLPDNIINKANQSLNTLEISSLDKNKNPKKTQKNTLKSDQTTKFGTNTTIATKKKSILIKSNLKKVKKYRSKKPKKSKKIIFNFGSFIIKSIITYKLFLLNESFQYYLGTSTISEVKNYVNVINLASQTWVGINKVTYSAIETVLWNDTSTIFGGGLNTPNTSSPRVKFDEEAAYFRSQILPNLTRLVDSGMSEFGEEYDFIMIKGDACGAATLNKNNLSRYCPIIFGGALKQGVIQALAETVNLSEELIGRWELSRGSQGEVEDLIRSNTFISYFGVFNIYLSDVLTFMINKPTTILTEILAQRSSVQIIQKYGIIVLRYSIIGYYLLVIVLKQLPLITDRLTDVFRLLPLEVIVQNRYIINVLLK